MGRWIAALTVPLLLVAVPAMPDGLRARSDRAAVAVDHPAPSDEPVEPSSLRRPGEDTGPSNPAAFAVVVALVGGWALGFAVILRRARRARDRGRPAGEAGPPAPDRPVPSQ